MPSILRSPGCRLALLLLCACVAGTTPAARGEGPALALTPKIQHELEQHWRSLQPDDRRNPGTRDLFSFVLEVAARGADPQLAEQALARAHQKREPDPASPLYGNYAWYWRDAHPDDRNAVEFSMQAASLTWLLYRDRLPPAARAALESELRYAVIGLTRHQVAVSYTNIFLMKAANCILLGEQLPDPALAREGYALFDQWLDYTRRNGIHEYSSPTYYGTDLGTLGLLVRYPREAAARAKAERVLRLFWTEIAANWFPPFAGIAGTHSRDYDFLRGHGILDHSLVAAGWITPEKPEAPDAFVELSAWIPPAEIRAGQNVVPRTILQRWGPEPWELSTHYVGRHFSLGSAGAGYGQQDKTLTVNLDLGPHAPIVNFAMDERDDPYGEDKVMTSGGHQKLTHLVPFLTSVQHGADVLLLAVQNPPKKPSPFARSLVSNVVCPAAAQLWLADGPARFSAGETRRDLPAGTTVFLRAGDVAVALRFACALDDHGRPAAIALLNDGGKSSALRFSAFQADKRAGGRVVTVLWVRAAEGLDEAGFARFRAECAAADTPVRQRGDLIEAAVPAADGTRLRLAADLKKEQRLLREGGDTVEGDGILFINGRDVGRRLLSGDEP